MIKSNTIIMTVKPNTLDTFDMLMLLGKALHEKNGNVYDVIIDFESDELKLVEVWKKDE